MKNFKKFTKVLNKISKNTTDENPIHYVYSDGEKCYATDTFRLNVANYKIEKGSYDKELNPIGEIGNGIYPHVKVLLNNNFIEYIPKEKIDLKELKVLLKNNKDKKYRNIKIANNNFNLNFIIEAIEFMGKSYKMFIQDIKRENKIIKLENENGDITLLMSLINTDEANILKII